LAYYEALGRRARRRKSSAAQINLFGAALTALRQTKAADQNESLFVSRGSVSLFRGA
jgi:hypothetical protein